MLKLNTELARKSDSGGGTIKESGAYVGVITRAEKLTSKAGNEGLGLSFESDDGESANYLDLYIGETDGKPWVGSQFVNALLVCLKLREAKNALVKFKRYSQESGEEIVTAEGYPDIQGKRIGVLLKKELGEYNGKDTEKMVVVGFFDPTTRLTASEILDKETVPKKLDKKIEYLMKNPVNDTRKKQTQQSTYQQPKQSSHSNQTMDDFDDDKIPF